MLEIRYNTGTNVITGWCADPTQFGNLVARPGEAITTLPVGIPGVITDVHYIDIPGGQITGTPGYKPPPLVVSHWAVISAFNVGAVRPLEVKRTFEGNEYTVNCYVTEQVKDEYQGGTLSIGDYVLVEFVDGDRNKPIAFAQVYKSW